MLALGVNVLGNSPAFDCSRSVSVFVRRSPPNTPRASDTVATSGFPRLPLCFTRVQWTAEFLALVNCHCPKSAREAMSTYRLFLVLSKGLKLLRFLFVFSKIQIGVMKMKWWLKDSLMICTHENFLYNTGNVNRSYQKPCYPLLRSKSSLMCTKRCSRPLARISA
jgi:hypothetical protein